MQEAAQPAPARTPEFLPLRVLPHDVAAETARDRLIERLAADRLRDLRDEGVTLAYVAHMYGVEAELMEEIAAELMPRR